MEERDGATAERAAGGNSARAQGTPPAIDAPIDHQKIISELYWAKCDSAQRELSDRLPKVWEYCERHAAAGRHWHRCYALKLLELWEFLQADRPRTILELGSGCTTAVFSQYAEKFGVAFVTVDENPEFQSAVCADIVGNGEKHVASKWNKVLLVDPPIYHCGYAGVENLPIAQWVDLLYVDGPSNKMSNGKLAICDDAVLLKSTPPKAILFDIRRETVAYTKEYYGDKYRWDDSSWGQSNTPWYLSAIRHHTIARRRA